MSDKSSPSIPLLPEVVAVLPVCDRWLTLTFATGETRQYDVDPWLSKGVFQALRDPMLFRQAYVRHGTVCWPGNLDIDPQCLWEKSQPRVESEAAVAVAEMQAFIAEGQALQKATAEEVATNCDPASLYYDDPEAWAELQIQLLHAENWGDLDKAHLIEVLERWQTSFA